MKATKVFKTVLLIFLLAFTGILLVPAIWLEQHTYEQLIAFVLSRLNRPDLYERFVNKLFTKDRYQLLYKLHWLIYPFLLFLWFLILIRKDRTYTIFKMVFKAFAISFYKFWFYFKTKGKKEKSILLFSSLFYFLLSYYKVFNLDITYDEAWNYNYIIGNPPYFSFLVFNTYPLYHFIASVIDWLPGDSVILARSISIISGWFLLLFGYYMLQQFFGKKIAFLLVCLLLASPLFILYSAFAKGIVLSTLFSSIQLYCFEKINSRQSKRHVIIFYITAFLNLICLSTTLVFTTILSAGLIFQSPKKNKRDLAIKYTGLTILVIVLSAFFYLPLFFSSDISSIINNPQSNRIKPLYAFFYETSILFWGNRMVNIILVFIGALLVFHKRYNQKILAPLEVICLTALFVFFKQLPDRTLCFLLLPYLLIIGALLQYIAGLIKKPLIKSISYGAVILLSLFSNVVFTNRYINPVNENKFLAKEISNWMLHNHVKTCYVQHPDFWVFYPIIEYYYSKNKQHWKLNNNQPNSVRYLPYSASDKYDCIVTDSIGAKGIGDEYVLKLQHNSFKLYLVK
ncbi:MAG: glycosyltransferase family 39 protein [Bacteroidota bacterium]